MFHLVVLIIIGCLTTTGTAFLPRDSSADAYSASRHSRRRTLFKTRRAVAARNDCKQLFVDSEDPDDGDQESIRRSSSFSRQRRKFLSKAAAAVLCSLAAVDGSSSRVARAAEDTSKSSIRPCKKDPSGSAPTNCVSTASVKQVDLYMAPWVWPEGTDVPEVMGRLKGAIASDSSLTLQEQGPNYLRVTATRNFCVDELLFVINPADRVVTFQSQQIEGPETVSDFGANRKRLDELRKQTQVLQVMGEEFASADAGPREGAVGQLKAFWGLQSGGGYEAILLDDDDY